MINKRENHSMVLTALFCLMGVIIVVLMLMIHTPQQPPFYSLIVIDASNHEWAVDYNLTYPDCQAMLDSPSARCELQLEGKLP